MTTPAAPGITMDELVAAREIVGRRVPPTPQYAWPLLAAEVGAAEVWVKHENHTPTGAFKVRGGLVYVDRLRRELPEVQGLVSATRGNEAIGVLLRTTHNLAEPAGAVATAGLLKERQQQHGRRVATVLCGGNLDAHLLVELLAGRTPQV